LSLAGESIETIVWLCLHYEKKTERVIPIPVIVLTPTPTD
jgi:hypothetical protein